MKKQGIYSLTIIKLIVLLMISVQAHALDLGIDNYTFTPGSNVNSNTNYTISFNVRNFSGNGDSSSNPRVVLDLDGLLSPSSIIVDSTIISPPSGWFDATESPGVLIFDIDLTSTPLLDGQSLPFEITLKAGTTLQSGSIFTRVSDFLITDTNSGNDTTSTFLNIISSGPPVDLVFGALPAPYNIIGGDLNPVVLDFPIQNNSPTPADYASTNVQVMFDHTNFSYNNAASLTAGFSCSVTGNTVTCQDLCTFGCNTIDQGSPIVIRLAFDPNVSAPVGTYNFDGTLRYEGSIVSTLPNIVNIQAAVYDLQMTANNTLGTFLLNPPAMGNPLYSFEIENVGNIVGFSTEQISIHANAGFILSNPAVTSSSGSIWSCFPMSPNPDDGYDCFNSGTNVALGEIITFSGMVTTYPTAPGLYTDVFRIVTSADDNTANDIARYDFNVPTAIPDLEFDTTVNNPASFDFNVGDTITLHDLLYTVTNTGDDVSAITFTVAYNSSFNVAVTGTGVPSGWVQSGATTGLYTFTRSGNFANGDSSTFNLTLQMGGGVVADLYDNAVIATLSVDNGTEVDTSDNIYNTDIVVSSNSDLVFHSNLPPANVTADFGDSSINVNVSIDNIANGATTSPIGFTYDTNNFSQLTFNLSASTIDSTWECIEGPPLDCHPINVSDSIPGMTTAAAAFTLVFDLQDTSSTPTPIGAYALTANLYGDDISSNNSSSTTLNVNSVVVEPDIVIDKTFLSGVVSGNALEGSQVTYRILAQNNTSGSVAGNNVVFTDVLPFGVTYNSHILIGPNFNCDFVTGTNTLTCTASSIPFTSGDDGVDLIVNVTGPINQTVDNTVNVTADNDINTGNNSSSSGVFTITPLILSVDFTIGKTAQLIGGNTPQTDYNVDQDFEYVLVVHNNGPDIAPIGSVEIIDIMPSEITVGNLASVIDWSCNSASNTVTCTNSTPILGGGSVLKLALPASGSIAGNNFQNNASASVSTAFAATVIESNTGNNDDSYNVNIHPLSGNLTLTKSVTGGVVGTGNQNFAIGDTVIYTLIAENTSGTNPITDLVITDTLDTGFLQFSGFNIVQSDTSFDCSFDTISKVTCTNENIADFLPGAFFEVIIEATTTTAGLSVNNTANISSIQTGDTFNSNTVAIDIEDPTVLPTTLTVSKEAIVASQIVPSVTKGTSFDYRITITSGSEPANNLIVLDDMPVDVIVNGFAGTNWSCNINVLPIACNFSGPLAAGGSTVLNFNVTDNSASAVIQLQNSVTANASNASSVSVLNDIDLTSVAFNLNVTQSPNSVEEGAEFEINIVIDNQGSEVLKNIVVINTLPEGFSYVPQRSSVCIQNGLIMTCTVDADIAVNASETIVIAVDAIDIVDINTTYTNLTTASGSNFPTLVTSNTDFNVTQAGQLDYSIDINDNIDPAVVNSPYVYTVSMTNDGSLSINSMTFNVNIPIELALSTVIPSGFNCLTNSNGLTCNSLAGFNVNPGETRNLLDFNVLSTNFIGSVSTAVDANINGLTKSAAETTQIIAGSGQVVDLIIEKTASISAITPDTNFSYTLIITNNTTNVDATNVVVTDNLLSGLTLLNIDAPDWNCNNINPITCSMTGLASGDSSLIEINVSSPNQLGIINNIAYVSSAEQESQPLDNTSQASVNVTESGNTNISDLQITASSSVSSIISEGDFFWEIQVHNNGPDSALNVKVTDSLPSGFNATSAVGEDSAICPINNNEVICTIGTLGIQEAYVIKIYGIATLAAGVLENQVTVSSSSTDSNSSNNTSQAHVTVDSLIVAKADISVDITTGEVIEQGESSLFTIAVTNNGPDSALSPTLDIEVVGTLESVSVIDSPGWECQVSSLSVACHFIAAQMLPNHNSIIQLSANTEEVSGVDQLLNVSVTSSSTTDDPDLLNNEVTSQIGVNGTPTANEILAALQTALDGRANQQVNRAIQNVASYCGRKFFNALEGFCRDLYDTALAGDGDTINNVMEQITPNEVIGQSTSVAEIARAQFRNIGARLSQIRGGGGSGFSSAGLNARYGSGGIPLGMLAYLNKTDDETDGLINTTNDFISPWGFFVNGTISMGERDATGRELGFDFDSYGLTAGVDYRLDAKKVIGIAVGYANFDSKIEDSAELGSTGVTLTGYGSFYINDNFYIDTRISLGKPKFDQSRDINFTLGTSVIDRTAKGETSANQYSFAMSAGYHFNKNSWNITPNATIRYVKTSIDGFAETGAGDFNFAYSGQELESLVWSAGVRVSKAVSLKNGVITPQFDFDYNYESLNNGNDIEARFIMAPTDEIFIIETDSPDRTYGSAGLGFVYITSNGKQAYINYRSILGLEGFSRGTYNIGARFEF